jgi:hypothetical protein
VLERYLDRVYFTRYRVDTYTKGGHCSGVDNVATCDMGFNKRAIRNNNAFAGGNYTLSGLLDLEK